MNEKDIEQIIESRVEFIDKIYPGIFGEDEMGDPSVELEPKDITGILAAYESHLALNGLLNITNKEEANG